MKRTLLYCLLAVSGLQANVSNAAPISIDFNSYAGLQPVSSIGGVSFSLVGGPVAAGNTPSVTDFFVNGYKLLTNTPTGGGYPTAAILRVIFDGVADDVAFGFYNAGYSSFGGRGASFFTAFDIDGNVLETGSLAPAANAVFDFALANDAVHSLEFNNNSGGTDSWWFGLATLTARDLRTGNVPDPASSIPEPGSFALTGLAVLGLALARRRGKRA